MAGDGHGWGLSPLVANDPDENEAPCQRAVQSDGGDVSFGEVGSDGEAVEIAHLAVGPREEEAVDHRLGADASDNVERFQGVAVLKEVGSDEGFGGGEDHGSESEEGAVAVDVGDRMGGEDDAEEDDEEGGGCP